jgi:hypothetical protein
LTQGSQKRRTTGGGSISSKVYHVWAIGLPQHAQWGAVRWHCRQILGPPACAFPSVAAAPASGTLQRAHRGSVRSHPLQTTNP